MTKKFLKAEEAEEKSINGLKTIQDNLWSCLEEEIIKRCEKGENSFSLDQNTDNEKFNDLFHWIKKDSMNELKSLGYTITLDSYSQNNCEYETIDISW